MADNVTFQSSTIASPPAGLVVATDDVGGVDYQIVKLAHGPLDTATIVSTSSGLPVNVVAASAVPVTDNGGSLTVDGTVAATQSGSWTVAATQSGSWGVTVSGSVAVTDNAGSLTVDAPVGTPVFVRLSDGSSAITTLPVSLASLPSLAAGTALIGSAAVAQQTDVIRNGTSALTPTFATISASGSGNTTVVAADATRRIRVLGYRFQAAGDVNVEFRTGTTTAITGSMPTGAKGGGGGAAFCPVGHFQTGVNEALTINLSSAVAVGGHVVYVLV